MKRILYDCHYVEGVTNAWNRYGFEVTEPDRKLDKLPKDILINEVRNYQSKENVEYMFSFDFNPVLAEVCYELKLIYISWVLDCPHVSLWSKAAAYDTNRIYVFDLVQYRDLLKRGLTNVWYQPICADIDNFDKTIGNDGGNSKLKYGSDVAFVGNLYSDVDHSLYDQISYLPPYLKGYLEALMEAQKKMWGADLLSEAINARAWKELKENVKWDLGDRYESSAYEMMMKNIIGQKITQMERMEACSYLAEHFDFALYTDSDTSFDPKIRNMGHADYLKEMPLIFHYSKINLHITLRSITSGMSLRVLDVLACGGFLLTNYQPEIAEYFVDGEDLVMYYSFEDMYEKIRYYLEHEEERIRIARAGYLKVKENFNYMNGIGYIVETLGETHHE